MNIELPDDFLEIDDPEIDPTALMAEIRERMRRRREMLGVDERVFPSFEVTACPEPPTDIPHDANLYYHLRRANQLFAQFDTDPALAPSLLARLPIVGPLWQRLRPALHALVLIYVNRLAGQQISVNRHLVSVLNQLTERSQEQDRALRALQAQLEALRSPGD